MAHQSLIRSQALLIEIIKPGMEIWRMAESQDGSLEPEGPLLVEGSEVDGFYCSTVNSPSLLKQFYHVDHLVDESDNFKGVTLSAKAADEVYQSYLAHKI